MSAKTPFPHPSWIEVDLAQLRKNIGVIRHHIGSSLFCFVVKANAYGHGLCEVGRAAEKAGVDYLGVAHLQEGIKLRQAGIQIPILVLGAIHEDQIQNLIHYNLEFTISSKFKAELAAKKCQEMGRSCRVHLEVDTGMHRTGVRCSTALEIFPYLQQLDKLQIVGIYSHLAKASDSTDPIALKQIEAFHQLLENPLIKGTTLLRHLANSGGTLHFPQAHLDMVRPSLVTLGYLPANASSSWKEIAPCFSLKAKVSYFKVVQEGEGISYNHTYVTPRKTRIVTVPVGYGDGYRRSLSNKGSVLIRGKRFPIRGDICMDQFMVDVGDEEVYVGDEVVLIGKQGNAEITLKEVAGLCDTIPYEILCQLNERIPRNYIN